MFHACRAVLVPLSLLLIAGFSSAATAKTGKVSVAMQHISGAEAERIARSRQDSGMPQEVRPSARHAGRDLL
jgi:hypothetical protein